MLASIWGTLVVTSAIGTAGPKLADNHARSQAQTALHCETFAARLQYAFTSIFAPLEIGGEGGRQTALLLFS